MTPVEAVVFGLLVCMIALLTLFIFIRRCKVTQEMQGTSEIETMYDYSPGIPPPKSISDADRKMIIGSSWSFLWN